MNEILKLIIEKNPGILTVFLSSIFLPIAILWLTNRHNRQMKNLEKTLDLDFKSKSDLREQEKMVYGSLSKILFDVQQLHVSLSGNCIDKACIIDSLSKFDASIAKCHSEIADSMLYMSSKAINLIYGFYTDIGELKIQLKELNSIEKYNLAYVAVYCMSEKLASTLIEVQDLFLSQRSDLKIEFDKVSQEKMRYCCGQPPPDTLLEEYESLKKTMIAHHLI